MIVKFMSDENAADDDSRKTFKLLAGVKTVEFCRKLNEGAIAILIMENDEYQEEPLVGNVYVMNDAGKTVSMFGVADLRPA